MGMTTNSLMTMESVDALSRVSKAMVASGYFKDARDVAQAFVKIQAGAELGLPPVASMSGIHVVQGKPVLGANLIATLIKNDSRYNYRVQELTDTICRIQFFEDGEACGESVFTADDAKKAGTQNMQKFPKNMLFARAISNGAKWFTPGIFGGITVYTPEELGAEVDEDGDIIDMPQSDNQVVVERYPPDIIKELKAVTGDTPLPDDEQVIYESPAADWMKAVLALVPRYDNAFAVKNALKKLGYTGVPTGNGDNSLKRLDMYRALKAHAAERDAEEGGTKQEPLFGEVDELTGGAFTE